MHICGVLMFSRVDVLYVRAQKLLFFSKNALCITQKMFILYIFNNSLCLIRVQREEIEEIEVNSIVTVYLSHMFQGQVKCDISLKNIIIR